jgi:signal transduction histidine kinase
VDSHHLSHFPRNTPTRPGVQALVSEQESEELREMDRLKNHFLSLFSDDLRTPLARIEANLDRVSSSVGSLPGEARNALPSIGQANADLARRTSDTLSDAQGNSHAPWERRGRRVQRARRGLRGLAPGGPRAEAHSTLPRPRAAIP